MTKLKKQQEKGSKHQDGESRSKKSEKQSDLEQQARLLMKNPCFVLAHELYDALPIHQFHFSDKHQWCEKVVKLDPETD